MQASPETAPATSPARLVPAATPVARLVEPTRREGVARALFAALLTFEHGGADAEGAKAALADQGRALAVAEADYLTEAGDARAVLSGRAVPAALADESRRLLMLGYGLERADLRDEPTQQALDERVARAVGGAAHVWPLCLGEGLRAASSPLLRPFLEAAVAVVLADGGRAREVPMTLAELHHGQLEAPAASPAQHTLLAALDVLADDLALVARLVREVESPAVLVTLLSHPAARGEALIRLLVEAREPRLGCVVAWLALTAPQSRPSLAAALVDAREPRVRLEACARVCATLLQEGPLEPALPFIAALAASWPPREPAPASALAELPVDASSRARFFAAWSAALDARAPTLATQAAESALETALSALESGAALGFARSATRVAVASAFLDEVGGAIARLVARGQGAAVAAQFSGAGAEIELDSRPGALARWAELLLAGARCSASAGSDALPLYGSLVAIFARAPERLAAFGPATTLLAPLRARVLAAFGVAAPGQRAEVFARLDRERQIDALAMVVARADGVVRATAAKPAAELLPASAPAPAQARAGGAFSVPIEAVVGVDTRPPTRVGELVRGLSGFEVLRAVLLGPLRLLGYRRSGRLEVFRDAIVLEEESRFLGQKLRSRRQDLSPSSVARIERVERAPRALLVLGLCVLALLTWFGASVAFDGFAIGDPVLIAAGAGAMFVGLAIDYALYGLFRRARGQTRISLHLRDRRGVVRFGIERADADRVLEALRQLRLDAPRSER